MASINSRPLFIIVALSMLIFAPMLQFGWRTARSGVTSRVCSLVQPRNGPPEPVRRMRRSSLLSRPAMDWKIAECSESTGRISAPQSAASAMTISPAHTSVSLFASAMRRF